MIKYDSYKDSGIAWMGDVPSTWVVTKNRYALQKFDNGKNKSEDTSVLSLTKKGISVRTVLSTGRLATSYIGHQLVEKGDIVFCPRDLDNDSILSGVSAFDGCISNLYIVDKTKDGVLNHFVNYYWYGLKYSVEYFKNFSYGMRYSFNREQFDEIPFLLPPFSDQQRIVRYLDAKIALIDSLTDKSKRKIELLKEQRTSVISECVTKGLDSTVEMKDSGVEWIGAIPSHWKISKMKFDTATPVRYGLNISSEKYAESGVRFIRTSDITENGNLTDSNDAKYLLQEDVPDEYLLNKHDVLFCRSGSIGKSYMHNVDGLHTSGGYLVRFNFRNYDESKFIFFLSKAQIYWNWVELNAIVSTIGNINGDKYQNFQYPKPPIAEQKKIVAHLDKRTQQIDALIAAETRRIALLTEYNKSLVSSVVTGKIRITEKML